MFSRRDKGLYTVGPMGGKAKQIAGGIPGAVGSVAIVSAEGGAPREVATGLASARYPVWTPDGERILFLGEDDAAAKSFDWYLIRTDGTGLVKRPLARRNVSATV